MRDGDAVRIAAIAPGSAGAAAGLAVDDRILAFDGAPAAQQRLAEWRRRLREEPVGKRVSLSISRGGSTRKVDLVLADAIPDHAASP